MGDEIFGGLFDFDGDGDETTDESILGMAIIDDIESDEHNDFDTDDEDSESFEEEI